MVNATIEPEFKAEVEHIKSEIKLSGWENVFENELNEVGRIHQTGQGSADHLTVFVFENTDQMRPEIRVSFSPAEPWNRLFKRRNSLWNHNECNAPSHHCCRCACSCNYWIAHCNYYHHIVSSHHIQPILEPNSNRIRQKSDQNQGQKRSKADFHLNDVTQIPTRSDFIPTRSECHSDVIHFKSWMDSPRDYP